MTAYPQLACGAVTFLHLRHGERHAVHWLYVVFLMQLKIGLRHVVLFHIWDSGYQHCYRSYSSKSYSGGSIQFSVVLIGYVQFVAARVLLLLSLLEVYLVACCLCSTEYGPCVGEYF